MPLHYASNALCSPCCVWRAQSPPPQAKSCPSFLSFPSLPPADAAAPLPWDLAPRANSAESGAGIAESARAVGVACPLSPDSAFCSLTGADALLSRGEAASLSDSSLSSSTNAASATRTQGYPYVCMRLLWQPTPQSAETAATWDSRLFHSALQYPGRDSEECDCTFAS